jgi:vanillate O-demethylase ferredoxin subunit
LDRIAARVNSIWQDARNVTGVELVPADGGSFPSFDAGAHIDVYLGDGICRQYSLVSDDRDRQRFEIAVKLEANSRGGSRAIHRLQQGDTLTIGLPRNNFPLATSPGDHVLFAGGIGITPFICMARTLVRNYMPFHLHYFTASDADISFWSYLSSPEISGRVTLHTGLRPAEVEATSRHVLEHCTCDSHIYLCGPSAFIECVQKVASSIRPGKPIRLEHFTSPAASDGEAFEVVLARSGQHLRIPPDRSILDVLLQNGTELDYACQKGICGTCIARLLDGIPDHRDMFLTAEERIEGKSLALCVSRGKGRLLLDL